MTPIPIVIEHSQGAIRLRPYCQADAGAEADLEADPLVKQFLRGPIKESKAERMQRFDAEKLNTEGFWAVASADDDRLVGRVGLFEPTDVPDQLEMVIVLARSHMGRDLGGLIAKVLIEEAFSHPNVEAVRATCDRDHEASLRLLRRLGFVPTEATIFDRHENRDAYELPRDRWHSEW